MVSTHLKLYSQNGFIFPKYGYSKNKNCFKPPPSCHFSEKKSWSASDQSQAITFSWMRTGSNSLRGEAPPATVGFVYLFFQLQVNNFPTVGFANGPKINMSREKGSFLKGRFQLPVPSIFSQKSRIIRWFSTENSHPVPSNQKSNLLAIRRQDFSISINTSSGCRDHRGCWG